MKCNNCGHENAGEAKFCSQCGHNLAYPCPTCGALAQPGDRFCSNCGAGLVGASERAEAALPTQSADDLSRYLPEELLAKMRSARDGHAMEGERRTVTMLFADIQGSTAAAEQLDPEDWADIMNGAFSRLIAPIYRYEGTLAQLRGDSVLAFFGAPIAHEDDPVRALRASIEMVEAMAGYSNEVENRRGIPVHVRVGVNTGLVVVGAMGSDLRVEYTALGDAINVAARMEQMAASDTIRVTAHTLSLTNGMFESEELGPVEVKGKAEPVVSHRVLRYIGTQIDHRAAPLIGRSEELASLSEMADQVNSGSGRVVSLIAEAGVGKTRLLDEFEIACSRKNAVARRFDDEGEISWMNGASRSYDSSRPYSTIGAMLIRWWFGDGSEQAYGRVQQSVRDTELVDGDMSSYLGYVAGVTLPEPEAEFIASLETQVLNTKANQAVVSYVMAVARQRPTIVVIEDLHWADDLSLALVEDMMSLTETVALGLVLAMRPFREEPSWRIHEVAGRDHAHRHTTISLEPLAGGDSSALLDALLASTSIDPAIRQRILDRSEGNPLYLEQMARALAEFSGEEFDAGEVPSSLRGLLTARLDRLGEEQRYLVQLASVLGSEFDRAHLAALVDSADVEAIVTELLRAGILNEVSERPNTLGFRHALIQETAYETILKKTRRDLHVRVAERLIDETGATSEIARHLVAAERFEAAYPYLVAAGVESIRAMALADAIELLTTAIEHTPDGADPELIVRAHDSLGQAYALIPDLSQAAVSYQRLYDFGEDTQRPEAQVAALNRLAYATASIGADLGRAGEYLVEARRIAEENNDEIGLAEYHMNACFVASMGGDLSAAVAHDEETVRLGEQSGVDQIRVMGMLRRAANYISLLDWERGIPAVESALEDAEAFRHEEGAATVRLAGSATAKLARGDVQGALEEAASTIAVLDRFGSFFLPMGHRLVAQCHYELGNVETALSHFVAVSRTATAIGQPFTAAAGSSGMALVYATAGLPDESHARMAEAEEKLDGPIGEFLASTVFSDIGRAYLTMDEPERALDVFTRGLAASSTTQFIERPRLLLGRAMAHHVLRDPVAAEADLAASSQFAAEKDLGLYRAEIGFVEGLLALDVGDGERAGRALAAGHQEAMSRGQRLVLMSILEARARLAALSGDTAGAADLLESARLVVEAVGADIADESLKGGFAGNWQHQLSATD